MESMLKEFAELQLRVREDPTDWETFFKAAALWEAIIDQRREKCAGCHGLTWRMALDRQIAEYQHRGFWERMRTRITKRGQKT